jgi:peptide/nickel transport system permease protein
MVLVLTEDYIKMAEAKGLKKFSVVVKHGLRNSMISFLTVLGMEIGALVGNVVIVEQVFGWPGLGWLIFNAIQNRDYSIVQGVVLFICFIFILSNLLIDISYVFLNPQYKEYLRKVK